jgi:hypothetical protein
MKTLSRTTKQSVSSNRLHTFGGDRKCNAERVVLVARLQRVNAAQMQIIGEHRARRQLLTTRDVNAGIGFLDHACVERRISLFVRRLAAVDLRRNDRVSDITVIVADVLVEVDHVLAVAGAARREDLRLGSKAAKEIRHVVGGAAHQPESLFGPGLRRKSFRTKVRVRFRNLIAAPHRQPGIGRGKGHQFAVLRRRRMVEEAGDRTRRLTERRMRYRVRHALAIDEYGPRARAKFSQKLRARAQRCT